MPSRQLYLHIRDLLHVLHAEPENSVLVTLALLVTGLILGRNVYPLSPECREWSHAGAYRRLCAERTSQTGSCSHAASASE